MLAKKNVSPDQCFRDLLKGQPFVDKHKDRINEKLDLLREKGRSSFLRSGLPTTKMEEWKYTPVNTFLDKFIHYEEYGPGYEYRPTQEYSEIDIHLLKEDYVLFVFVEGVWAPQLSTSIPEDELEISTTRDPGKKNNANMDIFGNHVDMDHPFAALNTALFKDGLLITVKRGKRLTKPIYILHLASALETTILHTRVMLRVEPNASLSLVEHYAAIDPSVLTMHNGVTEITLESGASLHHHYIHEECRGAMNIQYARVTVGEMAQYNNYNFSFPGTDFIRHDLQVSLGGPLAKTHLFGFSLTGSNQLVDNHTRVDHFVADGTSIEQYKCIAKDSATAVFNGKVIVHPDAQRTNSYQQSNNLMLSDEATVYTKPQLEIFADDVKCTHGATLGQLDKEALFYLTSRGVRKETAIRLLMESFAIGVVEKVPDLTIRTYIESLMRKNLKQQKKSF